MLKGAFILFYMRYASDEHLFLAICARTIIEEFQNKSPEIVDIELGALTDETLGCLSLGRWWVYFTEM